MKSSSTLESTKKASSSWFDLPSITIKAFDFSYHMESEWNEFSALVRADIRDYELTGNEEGKQILITASDSLEDRYDPNVSRSGP
jgi:hypothetical protein